jgi:hypothetical protein
MFSNKFLMKALALATGLLVVGGAARGAELAAYAGKSIALKDVRGTVYYAPHGDAFDVVVTLDSDGHPVRVISSLQPGQKTILSVPGALGEAATTIEIKREGDHLVVSDAARQPRAEGAAPIKSARSDD